MAEERMIFRCEDSVDGIFTAIYKAWEYGTSRSSVELNICATMRLFVQYADVEADYGIALKVADTIRNRLSEEVYNIVWRAALSDGADKAEHIYYSGRVCKDVSATFFRCKHVFAVINDKLFKACEKNHKAYQTYDYLSNAHEGFIVFKSYRVRYGREVCKQIV